MTHNIGDTILIFKDNRKCIIKGISQTNEHGESIAAEPILKCDVTSYVINQKNYDTFFINYSMIERMRDTKINEILK